MTAVGTTSPSGVRRLLLNQTVRTFAARLRGDIDLGTVRVEIVDTANSAVRPTRAAVWLRGGSR